MGRELTGEDFSRAAVALGTDIATVRAVVEIEAAGSGFLPDGRPKILYEAHVFHRLTKGRFAFALDRNGVPLSAPRWNRALYGKQGAHQWDRLDDAAKLDWSAAHRAASWGAAQILGENFKAAGYNTIEAFVSAMMRGEAGIHLDGMVAFIKHHGLAPCLHRHDWPGFARGYNGAGYKANRYDSKLAAAYRKWKARA